MAGNAHVVDVPAEVPPWPLAFEVAASTPPGSWALVGGLMVHVHALRAGIEATRPTRDIDLLLNIGASSVSAVAGSLMRIGFAAVDPSPGNPIHRFTRGEEDVVDLMVARDVRARTRWQLRPLLRSPGAAQALQRRDTYSLTSSANSVTVEVPDELGAIIAKAAAYAVDSRNPGRHLEDLAVLAAAAGSRRSLALSALTRKDRQHLRRVVPYLADVRHPAWRVLGSYDQAIGQRVWAAITTASTT